MKKTDDARDGVLELANPRWERGKLGVDYRCLARCPGRKGGATAGEAHQANEATFESSRPSSLRT